MAGQAATPTATFAVTWSTSQWVGAAMLTAGVFIRMSAWLPNGHSDRLDAVARVDRPGGAEIDLVQLAGWHPPQCSRGLDGPRGPPRPALSAGYVNEIVR